MCRNVVIPRLEILQNNLSRSYDCLQLYAWIFSNDSKIHFQIFN